MTDQAHGQATKEAGIAGPRTAEHKKWAAQRIQQLLLAAPHLEEHYKHARQVIRAFRRPAFYEVSTRCNLKCEGCYYFEDGKTAKSRPMSSEEEWKRFYSVESARGVSMAYFVGAEPALEPKRLMAAAPFFPYGNIGTNGTIKIPREVPYRIGVSVWAGDDSTDRLLRGGSVFRKALEIYKGDRRAIMLFTLSRKTIDHIPKMTQACRDHGLPLTFNIYSPTTSFLNKLRENRPHDRDFFRFSTHSDNPLLSAEDLNRIRHLISEQIDAYPETVIYDHHYNRLMSAPQPPHEVDRQTGIAESCGSRIVEPMRYYGADLQQKAVKCCTPDVDCRSCRLYSGGWSSRFVPSATDLATIASFEAWLKTMRTLGRIFLLPREDGCISPAKPLSAADNLPEFAGVD